MHTRYFSDTYAESRQRFIDVAHALHATVSSYEVAATSEAVFTMDVAVLGAAHGPALVVSSGVHGVEGFFGAAVQLAWLHHVQAAGLPNNLRIVLIHGVNPVGFAHLRRVNEDNIDLNRNFLTDAETYTGAPSGYRQLHGFLNPPSPPSRLEPFTLKALWHIMRTGLGPLKAAIAGGQYEYPQGIFFGGHAPSTSTQIIQNHCDTWLAGSPHVVHIDFHTGLGPFGSYKLLVAEAAGSPDYAWYGAHFGHTWVESLSQSGGTAYPIAGFFGQWMQHHFGAHVYRFVGAEFGTYHQIRVLGAIRAENRAHHYGRPTHASYRRAKAELRECFCPSAASWRQRVVQAGLHIIEQGIDAATVDDHA